MKPKLITLRGGVHRGTDLSAAVSALEQLDNAIAYRVEITDARPASIEQNSGVYALYKAIALAMDDRTPRDVKRECKLCHGVPMLRAADPEYRAVYDAVLKPLPYERKLGAMDYWPVTRLMTKAQKSDYIDEIQRQYGVYLERAA